MRKTSTIATGVAAITLATIAYLAMRAIDKMMQFNWDEEYNESDWLGV